MGGIRGGIKEGAEKNKEIMICCLRLGDADMRKAGVGAFLFVCIGSRDLEHANKNS